PTLDAEERPMISVEDCVAMCGLDEGEIAAIVEHEHVPEIEAAAIVSDLRHRAGGPAALCAILVDDVRAACARGDRAHAAALLGTLRRFLHEHPEAIRPPEPTWAGPLA